MNSEQWQIIKSLFEKVVDLPEEQHLAELNQLSKDQEIIQGVLNLIHSEKQRQTSQKEGLNTIVVSSAHNLFFQQSKLAVGDKVGVYQIDRLIGEGGMGSVYLANRTDEQFDQQVAIKIIRQLPTNTETPSQLLLESKVLGQLSHPNIARIFDAGNTADNCPFIIMEYVDGENILDYCDNQKLYITARLQLFIGLCEAVQFAHQKGIIHRDIKPGNILITEIDGKAVPKIIDFGIAVTQTLTEKSENTNQKMDSFGTPLYMSPEQISDPETVDTRSDVYALGVLLFQMLSGGMPFKCDKLDLKNLLALKAVKTIQLKALFLSLDKTAEIAARRNTNPKLLVKKLTTELDAIIQKSLNFELNQRYASATELSKDIKRYLRNFPVSAMVGSTSYWLKKLILRNKFKVFAGSVVTISLVVGIFVINNARQTAEFESEKALAVNQYLSDLFAVVDPRKKGKEAKIIDLLEQSEKDIENKFKDQPLVKASLLSTFGQSRTGLGDYDAAIILLTQALALHEEHLGVLDEKTIHTANLIGEVYFIKEDYKKALEISELNLVRARKSLSNRHRLTMNLINNVATNIYQISVIENNKVMGLKALGMIEELYQLNIEVLGEQHLDTAFVRNSLAATYAYFGKHEQSLTMFLQNYQVLAALFGENNFYSLATLESISNQYVKLNQLEKAKSYAQRSYIGMNKIQSKEHSESLFRAVRLLNILVRKNDLEDAKKLVLELSNEIKTQKTKRSLFDDESYAFALKILGISIEEKPPIN